MDALDDDDRVVLARLRQHFDEGGEPLHPEDVAEITGMPEESVRRCLQGLYRAHLLEGATVNETDEPVLVTGLR